MKYKKFIEVEDNAPIYSKRIAELLTEKGLTQEDLSNMSGVSKSSITAWIQGDKNGKRTEPKINGLNAIAEALDVTLDYLIGRTDVKPLNLKLQAVCSYTGLSEETVQTLHHWAIAGIKNGDDIAKKRIKHLNQLLSLSETKAYLLSLFEYCDESELYADEIYKTTKNIEYDEINFLSNDEPNAKLEERFNTYLSNLFFGDRAKSKEMYEKRKNLQFLTFKNTQLLTKTIEKLHNEHLKKSEKLFIEKIKEREQ